MAPISVDKKWTSDPRRDRLAALLKDTTVSDTMKADAFMLLAWRIAQKYYFEGSLIPEKVWEEVGLPDAIIQCGLAEKTANGIYVRGSEKGFNWFFKKGYSKKDDKSRAGKRSAEVRKAIYGTAQPMTDLTRFDVKNEKSLFGTKSVVDDNHSHVDSHFIEQNPEQTRTACSGPVRAAELLPTTYYLLPSKNLNHHQEKEFDLEESKSNASYRLQESMTQHPDVPQFKAWLTEMAFVDPALKKNANVIMKVMGGFKAFSGWWDDFTSPKSKIHTLKTDSDRRKFATVAILRAAGIIERNP